MEQWQGRTAVITGGGRGFGKAFAEALARLGAHVVLVDRDGAAAGQAAADIAAAGGSASGLAGDVTDEVRIAEVMVAAAQARVRAMQMIGAHGEEQDIVEAMLYLASDRARFITGETLRVTGGMAAGV